MLNEDPLERLDRLGLGLTQRPSQLHRPPDAGENRQGSYAASTLDRTRLEEYAARVATETKLATNVPPVYKTVTHKVTETEIYWGGWAGLQRETRPVIRTIESQEIVMGPGWLLFETKIWIDEYNVRRYKAYEYEETSQWVLDAKGDLWKVETSDGFEEFKSGGTNRRFSRTAEPMTENDILALDHEYPYRVYPSKSENNVRGNRARGRTIRHAKGVGLSLALRNVVDGVAPFDRHRPGDRNR